MSQLISLSRLSNMLWNIHLYVVAPVGYNKIDNINRGTKTVQCFCQAMHTHIAHCTAWKQIAISIYIIYGRCRCWVSTQPKSMSNKNVCMNREHEGNERKAKIEERRKIRLFIRHSELWCSGCKSTYTTLSVLAFMLCIQMWITNR